MNAKKLVVLALLLVFAMTALVTTAVFAQTTDQVPATIFNVPVTSISFGLFIGLAWAVVGYAAANPTEPFTPAKFFLSLVIGLAVGVAAFLTDTSFNSASNVLAALGVTALLQKGYNIVLNRLSTLFQQPTPAKTGKAATG